MHAGDYWTTPEGKKEVIGFTDGYRESTQSWRELLLDLKARGLALAPSLSTGDGGMGFWATLREVFPLTAHQRCWVHKTANILNKLPKSVSAKAKTDLQGCLSRDKTRVMVFKLIKAAEKNWPRLRGRNQLPKLITGVKFVDGVEVVPKTSDANKTPPEKCHHQNLRLAPSGRAARCQ
jgi:transposase-like protein